MALKIRTGHLPQSDARKVLALFRQHLAEGLYQILDLTPRDFDTARTWLSTFHTSLRSLDALHLACAFNNGQILWTSDKPLAQAASTLGVNCQLFT